MWTAELAEVLVSEEVCKQMRERREHVHYVRTVHIPKQEHYHKLPCDD